MVATESAKTTRTLVSTRINGEETEFICEPRQSLLECLRDGIGLTGTKEGCNDGNCGACNVLMDGRLVNSCLVLGVEAQGAEIMTVEGMAGPAGLHPLQQAFLEQAALQCGICTPGFLVAARALLDQNPDPTEHDVRFWLAGNLCRCTGYDKIVRAVLEAARMKPAAANVQAVHAGNGMAAGASSAKATAKTNGKANGKG